MSGWDTFDATPEDIAGTEPAPAIPQGKTYPPPGYREDVRGSVDRGTTVSGLIWGVCTVLALGCLCALLMGGYRLVFWIAGL